MPPGVGLNCIPGVVFALFVPNPWGGSVEQVDNLVDAVQYPARLGEITRRGQFIGDHGAGETGGVGGMEAALRVFDH